MRAFLKISVLQFAGIIECSSSECAHVQAIMSREEDSHSTSPVVSETASISSEVADQIAGSSPSSSPSVLSALDDFDVWDDPTPDAPVLAAEADSASLEAVGGNSLLHNPLSTRYEENADHSMDSESRSSETPESNTEPNSNSLDQEESGSGQRSNWSANVSASSGASSMDSGPPPLQLPTSTRLKITILKWNVAAAWKWAVSDENCGICRMPFEACCNGCKTPGDECPLAFGECKHAFHMHCIFICNRHLLSASTLLFCPS
ncbi:unnamed protein product [Gongylonema pulchrum]|uniref:Zf-ANAPC11 domain-containing protein n=1 Tax=Gongylonema pulchrum TaxID=637853 RepID=A0A183DN50_9BILA|nr:unnamed protein product [Gongylonema pulchrum]